MGTIFGSFVEEAFGRLSELEVSGHVASLSASIWRKIEGTAQ
jgi:hypothetical protein